MENAVSNVENVDGHFVQISGFTMEYDFTATAQVLDEEDNSVVTEGERILLIGNLF